MNGKSIEEHSWALARAGMDLERVGPVVSARRARARAVQSRLRTERLERINDDLATLLEETSGSSRANEPDAASTASHIDGDHIPEPDQPPRSRHLDRLASE